MIVWIIFIVFVLIALALDLGVFNRTPHVIRTKEASIWTTVWVSIALGFSGIIYWLYSAGPVENVTGLTPQQAVINYITGYLVELSLSVDNIFVIAVIFSSFKIPQQYQHRVLFWGILGAVVFRALMILFGVALIQRFDWMTYIFGAFLIFTAYKMLTSRGETSDPHDGVIYKTLSKIFPVTPKIDGQNFIIIQEGKRFITPLFIALIIIEFTDILFALDSIPAILAITSEPFIVFSSNILAILGLRSMYFMLSRMLEKFRYLEYSLVAILTFVGIKMLLVHHFHFPEWTSLAFIGVALAAGIIYSLKKAKMAEASS
ncbi:MAG: TerC family protein [Bacteroidota bacterium]